MAAAAFHMINGTLIEAGKINDTFQKLVAGRGRHNLVMGKPNPGDMLLYEEKIRKGHSTLPVARQNHTFTYKCKPNESISCVVVQDGWDDDTGGNPEKLGGGPGQNHVEVKVMSKIGRGMDFSFFVYGRK